MSSEQPAANGHSHQNGKYTRENSAGSEESSSRYSRAFNWTCLLGYSLSFIVFGSQVSILGPTIAPLAEHIGVSEPDLSPLFTALGIACIISGTPSGWLVDRMPTHRVLLGSLLVQAVGFGLVPFMPSVWSLTALYFVICFSYNFTNSAVFTSLGWMFPKRAGSALNLVLAMFGVGSFCIPLAAQACKYLLGSALAVFWVVSATSVLAAIPFLFVASPTPPPPVLIGEGPMVFLTPSKVQTLERITVSATVLLVFFTTAAETSIGNWLYTYGVRQEGLSDDEAALGNSAFWGSFTVGRVLGAAISHMTTPATLLLTFTPLAMVGASLPLWAGAYLSPWHLLLSTAVLTGLGNSTGYANALALLETYVPVTGFVNGIFGMVAGGACMVGPTAVALLAKYTSLRYSSMAWVGGIFYALHYPAILLTMATGKSLLKIYESSEVVDTGADAAEAGAVGGSIGGAGGLTEPLLGVASPIRAPMSARRTTSLTSPIAAPAAFGHGHSHDAGHDGSRLAPSTSFRGAGSLPTGPFTTRSSIPGHGLMHDSPMAVYHG